MRQVREVVGDIERAGTGRSLGGIALGFKGCPAVLLRRRGLAGRQVLEGGEHLGRAAFFGLGFVPLDLEGVTALFGGPGALRHHGDAGGDLVNGDDARDLSRGRVIEGLNGGPEPWRMGDHGCQHLGQDHILGVERGPVRLDGRILSPHQVCADQGEGLGVLQFGRLRRRDLGGLRHQRPEPRLLAGRMADDAVGHRDLGGGDTPGLGRSLDQHGAGRRAGGAQQRPGTVDCRGAAGALHPEHHGGAVELGVGRRLFHHHLAPVGVQLLGDDGGQARVTALAELNVLGHHRDRPVRRQLQERPKRARLELRPG